MYYMHLLFRFAHMKNLEIDDYVLVFKLYHCPNLILENYLADRKFNDFQKLAGQKGTYDDNMCIKLNTV